MGGCTQKRSCHSTKGGSSQELHSLSDREIVVCELTVTVANLFTALQAARGVVARLASAA